METFKKINRIQRNLVLIFYIALCLALIIPVWTLFTSMKVPYSVDIIVVILFLVIFVLLGAYSYLIVFLPERLNRNFDIIRNKIALGEIDNVEKFSKEVISFLIKHFDYIFFDIEYAGIGVREFDALYLSDDLNEDFLPNKEKLFRIAADSENPKFLGTIKPLEKKSYLYLVPVWFYEENIGFIIVVTNRKLGNLFKGILKDFENYYFDDQLKLVIRLSKLKKGEAYQ
ncbi:MAG TPA: hypothetical protein P5312_05925 [Bacteroidales bacterium]|nr:hypothetical protein [Bacteroidales bacterium]HRS99564.1 hypothetical protein [Bacteroidales bacterium]